MSAHQAATKPQREWLTIHEASALIGVSPATLRRWSNAGDVLAFTTPGGHRRFSRTAVLGLLPTAGRSGQRRDRLGYTRIQYSRANHRPSAGTTNGLDWIEALGDSEHGVFRDCGCTIATSLLAYIDAATPAAGEEALAAASAASAELGRIARRRRLRMTETVEKLLRVRTPFLREVAAVAHRRGLEAAEAIDLLTGATWATDRLVAALMAGYEEAATSDRPSRDLRVTSTSAS